MAADRLPGVGSLGQPDEAELDHWSILAGSPDLIAVSDRDRRYRFVSPASERLFGWESSEILGRNEEDFVHPDDRPSVRETRAGHATSGSETVSYRFLCRDGTYRWVEATSAAPDSAGLVVSTIRNIGQRQERVAALEQLAATDPLTGVANRTVLMDRLRQGLRRLDRTSGVLAVLYLDLDRFKVINDSLGHRVGDATLLQMAERLTHHLRPADTLARLGGDEFVLVVEGLTDEAAAVELANRIIEAGRKAFRIGDQEFVCTLSVGIATTADSQRAAGDLLHEADLALYRAKNRGRDRAEVFGEELRTKAVGRLVTERMLRRVVYEERVVVEYQPIFDLHSGRIVSAEALVRIRDSDDVLLQPPSFLEVAEETGLLIVIDEEVMSDALTQAAAWRGRLGKAGPTEVALNVTARHLADTGFYSTALSLLSLHGLPNECLQIEVTERVLMEMSNSAMTALRALRETGVQVGLDNFGTGYSSLAYLRQFPLDFVKIDKSFIGDLENGKAAQAIVGAIVDLAHALGLFVVAEGVETLRQRRIVENLGCDRAQGFLLAGSSRPEAIDRLIRPGPTAPPPG